MRTSIASPSRGGSIDPPAARPRSKPIIPPNLGSRYISWPDPAPGFLIDTLTIRNRRNSLKTKDGGHF